MTERRDRRTITIKDSVWEMAKELGEGSASKGIEKAVEQARWNTTRPNALLSEVGGSLPKR